MPRDGESLVRYENYFSLKPELEDHLFLCKLFYFLGSQPQNTRQHLKIVLTEDRGG